MSPTCCVHPCVLPFLVSRNVALEINDWPQTVGFCIFRLIWTIRKVLYSDFGQWKPADSSVWDREHLEWQSIDAPEALSLDHLLLLQGKPLLLLLLGAFEKGDCYSRERLWQVQYLADLFWKKWLEEYLLMMKEMENCTYKSETGWRHPDLIVDEDSFPMGRVVERIPNSRGHVRWVKNQTQSNIPIIILFLFYFGWMDGWMVLFSPLLTHRIINEWLLQCLLTCEWKRKFLMTT